MDGFNIIKPSELNENAFNLIGKEWMLITAGSKGHYNTMTAAWGAIGVLWHKNVSIIYIRPQRYTYQFVESNDIYTLSFFSDQYKDVYNICGSSCGRDVNKAEKAGITAIETEHESVAFKEARLILECRKLYHQDLDPSKFIDENIDSNYAKKDYHRMYIGEILNVYTA
jgi:flavin reductase (DIM6/NTAB) family NADH-FMN oxidoreductase RutF